MLANYLQPAFLICVAVLALCGGGMSIAVKRLGGYLKKEPTALKKPLDRLDENGLGVFKVVRKDKIENEDVVESLGTEEYIQWQLEDTSVLADSPTRFCLLFITYYELPDVVPHTPEECYTGGGFQKLGSESVKLVLNRDGAERRLDARYVLFAGTGSDLWATNVKFPVLYILNANGRYAGSRDEARMILNRNLFGKHSYFSKIEWKFFNKGLGGLAYPNKKQAIAASEKLLSVMLDVLDKQYWPAGQWR